MSRDKIETTDAFREFSEAFQHWQWLLPPIGDLRNPNAPTYPIELDLDHELSSLASVGKRALEGDTKPDWPKIVPGYLAHLHAIERNVAAAAIPDERKRKYENYISECRSVWQKISRLPVPADGHLGFRKYVLSSFRFLEESHEFRVTETSPIKVRYESNQLFIELNYSPRAPELGFELGSLVNAKELPQSFSLDDLAYWAGFGLRFDYDHFQLDSPTGLAEFIVNVARFVEQHARPLLSNDLRSLDSLAAKQAERERRIAEEPQP
jgi:hypothetical protein